MKAIFASLAIALLATSVQASDIKVYAKGEKAEAGSQSHGIALSRAEHKRRKSKKWGRVTDPDTGTAEASQSISGHRKKKSPKESGPTKF